MPSVFRFAPSPNGYLHLGHAYSALLNFDSARRTGGRFLLRIEDIDATRCRPEFENAICEDLAWLGMSLGKPGRRQSEPPAPDGAPLYPGTGKALGPDARQRLIERGAPYALRLDMTAARGRAGSLAWIEQGGGLDGESGQISARPEAWGDIILARKETPTSYHLSVGIDDALQGVTEVVRGRDLFWATSVHRLLQQLLGLPQPSYRPHRLLMNDSGQKLSKSTDATGLRELRTAGATPADIRRLVGLV